MASRSKANAPMTDADGKPAVYTASNGAPMGNPSSYQRIGQSGPLLLQDFHLIDLLAHFDRERIPERVVHAKGAGAYGEVITCHPFASSVHDVDQSLVRCDA